MTVSLRIATDGVHGPRRWFRVRIHDTVDQLRAAGSRYRPGEDFTQALGLCHPVRHPAPANGFAGVIRFARSYLTGEIVAHELLHASLVVYRLNVRADVRLGNGCGEREEQLAWIHGALYADFETHFHHTLTSTTDGSPA